jgi:hypothetical protein
LAPELLTKRLRNSPALTAAMTATRKLTQSAELGKLTSGPSFRFVLIGCTVPSLTRGDRLLACQYTVVAGHVTASTR